MMTRTWKRGPKRWQVRPAVVVHGLVVVLEGVAMESYVELVN